MKLTAVDLEEHRVMLTGRARTLRFMFDWPPEIEVEDVVSAAIARAWEKIDQFRGDPKLRGQVASWLLEVLKSEVIDTIRRAYAGKRGLDRTRSFEDYVAESDCRLERFLAADLSTASSRLQKQELLQAVCTAIELLPDRQRTCILARFLGEWPIDRIVADLNRPANLAPGAEPVTAKAVTSLIERALKKLRELLQHLR